MADGASQPNAFSLGSRDPAIAGRIGDVVDVKADELIISGQTISHEAAKAILLDCARLARHDHETRFALDVSRAAQIDEKSRRSLFATRRRFNRIYAGLYEIAAEFGPDCRYSPEIDAQLEKNGHRPGERRTIEAKVNRGFVREVFLPGSRASGIPPLQAIVDYLDGAGVATTDTNIADYCRVFARALARILFEYSEKYEDIDTNFDQHKPAPAPLAARRMLGNVEIGPPPWALADALMNRSFQVQEFKERTFSRIAQSDTDIEFDVQRYVLHVQIPRAFRPDSEIALSFPLATPAHEAVGCAPGTESGKSEVAARAETYAVVSASAILYPLASFKTCFAPTWASAEPIVVTAALPSACNTARSPSRQPENPPARADHVIARSDGGGETAPRPNDMLISALVEKTIAKNTEWAPKTQTQVRKLGKFLEKAMGSKYASSLTQKKISNFRDDLQKLPINHGKSSRRRDQTWQQLLDDAKALPPEKVGLGPSTINRYLSQTRAILIVAKTFELHVADHALLTDMAAKDPRRNEEKRASFSKIDVDEILRQPEFVNPLFSVAASLYWITLLVIYSGALLAELAGLLLEDVAIDGSFIEIRKNKERRLRNADSKRSLLLHPELIRLGFPAYVQSLRDKGETLLFPDLRERGESPLGDLFGKSFGRFLERVLPNAKAEDKSFHSFRPYVNTGLTKRKLNDALRERFIGQTPSSVNNKICVKDLVVTDFRIVLDLMPSVTDHLKPRKW